MTGALGPELPVGTKIGFYEVMPASTSPDGKSVTTCLGYGGFGALYKVSRGSKVYALKLAHRSLRDFSPSERKWNEERADREVGALKLLRHPNIVRIHAFDMWPDEEGRPFLVMDLVEGQHLDTWRATQAPSLRRICEVFIAIGRALGAAHKQQVFHRDIKCENVLVRSNDGQPIIVDWGVARPRNAKTVTAAGGWLGTSTHFSPEYCRYALGDLPEESPEAQRFRVTPQSELHAVGFMFFQVLTDESPFPNEGDDFAIMRSIINHQVLPPSSSNPNVPKELDAIVLKLLAKKPSDRFESGDAFADAVQAFITTAGPRLNEPFDLPHSGPAVSIKDTPPPAPAKPAIPATIAEGPRREAAPDRLVMSSDAQAAQHVSIHSVNVVGEVGPEGKTAPPPHLAIEFAKNKILAAKEPQRLPSGPLLIALIVALGVGAFALLARLGSSPKPESLLARVQASDGTPSAPSKSEPSAEQKPSSLPPVPPIAASAAGAIASRQESVAPAKKAREDAAPTSSDARAIDREIAEKYGRPRIVAQPGSADSGAHVATAAPEDDVPSWLRPVEEPSHNATGPKVFGVPTGALIRARLQNNLDSRTVSDGPATAKLVRGFIMDGKFVFPSGTLLFGQAAVSGSRFTIRFSRLRLPDRTEVAFEGIAYSVSEHQAGLAASRSSQPVAQDSSTAGRVAKGAAGTLLSAAEVVAGGNVAATVGAEGGRTALDAQSQQPSSPTTTLMLDEGTDLDVFVVKPF